MICKKCGNAVLEGDLFCEKCGEKIVAENLIEQTSVPTIPTKLKTFIQKVKADKKTRNICFVALGSVLAAIVAIGIIISVGNTVKLTNYITAEVVGIDGYGRVNVAIDEEKLCEVVLGPEPADTVENLFKYIQYEEKCDKLLERITVLDIKNNGKFSNNDTAEIEIIFESTNAEFDKTIKGGIFKYEISGLEKGTVINPFANDYVNIVFSGANGFGVGEVETVSRENWTYDMTYTFSQQEKLTNGDKITVTAEIQDSYEKILEELLEEGKVIEKKTTKEITVTGLAVYASASDVSQTMLDTIEGIVLKEYQASDNSYTRKNLQVVGVYFKDKIDKSTPYYHSWYGLEMYNSIDVIISYVDNHSGLFSHHDIERTVHIVFENIEKDSKDLNYEMKEAGFEASVLTADEAEVEFFDELSDTFNITKLK